MVGRNRYEGAHHRAAHEPPARGQKKATSFKAGAFDQQLRAFTPHLDPLAAPARIEALIRRRAAEAQDLPPDKCGAPFDLDAGGRERLAMSE
jgi:hypothetical protein